MQRLYNSVTGLVGLHHAGRRLRRIEPGQDDALTRS